MSRLSWATLSLLLGLLASACSRGQSGSSPAPSSSRTASSIAAATPAPTSTPASTPTPAGTVYTVKSGDTLSSIARANNTTVEAILKTNSLSDPDKIQEGQKLVIPADATAASPAGSASSAPRAGASALPPPASKPPPP